MTTPTKNPQRATNGVGRRTSAVAVETPPVAAVVPEPPKLRRRPLMAVVAGMLIVLGGLGGAWAWMSAADTVEVVATRAAVERGDTLRAEDLTVVRVNPDPQLRTVPAADLSALVGQRATTDLVGGALVAPEQVTDALPPSSGMSVVGVSPGVGLMPAEPLRAGDRVRIVQTPGAQAEYTGSTTALEAEVLAVRIVGDTTVVDVLVPAGLAPELAARAATGKVAIVLDARER